jgi:transcription elongation factor Elf1
MSRCIICNVILSEQELKSKDHSGRYTNMCIDCEAQHELLVNDIEEEVLVFHDTLEKNRFNGCTSDDFGVQ